MRRKGRHQVGAADFGTVADVLIALMDGLPRSGPSQVEEPSVAPWR